MATRQISAGAVVAAVALAAVVRAAPIATKWQSSITSPTGATGATIKITKPSKVAAKVAKGSVTFSLKLSGVTDVSDAPVTNTSNTFQIDVLVGGVFSTMMFTFDLTNGKVSQKFPIANSSLPNGGVAAGAPVEIRGARVIQAMNGNNFGVAGITAK